MEAYLTSITGIDDAICSMFESKRNLTREKELEIRTEVSRYTRNLFDPENPDAVIGRLEDPSDKLCDWLETLCKWGRKHITMLRFVNLGFTLYGIHRGAQDDFDSHAMRLNSRIIRASTRTADFEGDEMSEYYQGKILTTDMALKHLDVKIPDEIEVGGRTYVRAVNGYILKGLENEHDVKRGLYMLCIPSDFISQCNLTEFSHIYKLRNYDGTAHYELQTAVESIQMQLCGASAGYFNRELLMAIEN